MRNWASCSPSSRLQTSPAPSGRPPNRCESREGRWGRRLSSWVASSTPFRPSSPRALILSAPRRLRTCARVAGEDLQGWIGTGIWKEDWDKRRGFPGFGAVGSVDGLISIWYQPWGLRNFTFFSSSSSLLVDFFLYIWKGLVKRRKEKGWLMITAPTF